LKHDQRTSGRAGSAFRAAVSLLLAVPVLAGGAGYRLDDGAEALDGLRTKLRSSDKWRRAEAVGALARLGTEAAWELVVGALADPKGEVADAAQLVLAALDEPDVLELLGKEGGLRAEDARLRARAAEVLGRCALDAPARWLERALGDDDPEVRRMAAWSLERLGRAGRLDEKGREAAGERLASRVRSERDPLARARELAALCALAPASATSALEEARRQREPLVRGAAAALVAEVFSPAEAFERLAPLAADPVASVRRVACESLATLRSRAAAARLVDRLGVEKQERLVLRLVELLQGLSGLKHRRDPRPWVAWLEGLPADWSGVPASAALTEAEPTTHTQAVLAGLPIQSESVAFLIDLSGSIWNVRPDGKTRKQIVDGRLREALEALPEDARFNLIPYTGKPHPWKTELVEATRSRVREAARWFEECKEYGSGNFWDAAMLALEDPEVDTLVVIFDGAPTGGTRHRLELIAPLFQERNFARRVVLDLVLVDADRHNERAWTELARSTGGNVVSVTF
jgi:HEAT repeat protein